jgi:hypothetical protein
MMYRVKLASFIVVAAPLALLSACGGGPGAVATTPTAGGGVAFDPAATNRAKCGACHAPFDPGGHTKADLEKVLKVHQAEKRVALRQDEWQQMIDYLAKK